MQRAGHGRTLRRSASTISRELGRNTVGDQAYGSHLAQQACMARQRAARPAPKLEVHGVAWHAVLTMLDWKWSPQQIAATLRRTFPDGPARHVSQETIYTAIYALPRGELGRQLIACLRQGHGTRLPRSRGNDRRGQVPEMVSIHVRPPEIEDRVMPGHWEGDSIKGAGNKSSVGVLLERSSRLVLLARMEDATAASALAGWRRARPGCRRSDRCPWACTGARGHWCSRRFRAAMGCEGRRSTRARRC